MYYTKSSLFVLNGFNIEIRMRSSHLEPIPKNNTISFISKYLPNSNKANNNVEGRQNCVR